MRPTLLREKILSLKSKGKKAFAVLIDPEKAEEQNNLLQLIRIGVESKIDFFLVGGSLLTANNLSTVIQTIKKNCEIPVILFPGSNMQIDLSADGILLLSLISGRNADLLIGQHVLSAPILKKSQLEILSTGYMIINSGQPTSVSYISGTQPIPNDKPIIAASTAMAGEMLGLQLTYLDAGSGAKEPVHPRVIQAVRKAVDTPIIVGGGLNTSQRVLDALIAGADMVVIGNGIEKNPNLIVEVSEKILAYNDILNIN
ncbi:geranylgeranylglyceryl/heptaprenylglyceryl phosphate synthase [Penaeicola halotolerans]|uniref:geranylgeranylglyceryl/heptaprenylglyceryl phosphate synthase n=1 Tax=Penaeicola halotolerans TaxID=2793196 RepID=UPI001CF81D32|nr:geranylgeranylglyceryl/heptaprenylglyceryl phosphate synthase [Penaeicola halotolerans]